MTAALSMELSHILDKGRTAARVEDKLDLISQQLDYLVRRQQAIEETIEEILPIAKVAMTGAIEQLDALERAGWFTFGRELVRVLDRVVRSYSQDDVRRLGDQVVGILDTVRNLTQPDMLAMMNEVATAVHDSDEADPKGMWGMMRATKDPEVRKGMGVLVAVLKQVGRAADKIAEHPPAHPPVRIGEAEADESEAGRKSWTRHLARRRAPTSEATPGPTPAPAPAQAPTPAFTHATPTHAPTLPAGYGPDGFLVDPATWTRDKARELAALIPLELTERHWEILDWARKEYTTTGSSPNIRRIGVGANVPVRNLYTLFPGKPGVLIAMLAGIPKPGGCL